MDMASYLATGAQNGLIIVAFNLIVIIVLAVFVYTKEHQSYSHES